MEMSRAIDTSVCKEIALERGTTRLQRGANKDARGACVCNFIVRSSFKQGRERPRVGMRKEDYEKSSEEGRSRQVLAIAID
jgi:hypothetical protein